MKPPSLRPEDPKAAKIKHTSAYLPRRFDWTQTPPHPELRTYVKLTADKPRAISQMDFAACNHNPQTMEVPLRTQSQLRQMRDVGEDTRYTGQILAAIPFNPMHPLAIDAKHRYNRGSYAATEEKKRMGVTVSTFM